MIRLARGADDLMIVFAIRGAVYLGEQECPYHEEFDGNDFCATHFIGYNDSHPAGVLRARYFKSFVKLERIAVLKQYRQTRCAFELVRFAVRHVRRKGFTCIYGHAQIPGMDKFWSHFGAVDMGKQQFSFSDHNYIEMKCDYEPADNEITVESGPYVIIRPEGEWDLPGVLEVSHDRRTG